MYKPKVGDWVLRKKGHLEHPFWQKRGLTPVQITYVGARLHTGYEISVEGNDGEWLSNFFDPCLALSISTNLEDWG